MSYNRCLCMKKIGVDFKSIIKTTMMDVYLNVSFVVVVVWMWQLKKILMWTLSTLLVKYHEWIGLKIGWYQMQLDWTTIEDLIEFPSYGLKNSIVVIGTFLVMIVTNVIRYTKNGTPFRP